jgi:hypothetical protein
MNYDRELRDRGSILSMPTGKHYKTSLRSTKVDQKGYSEHGKPTPFSEELAELLRRDLRTAFALGKTWNYVPAGSIQEPTRSEIYRFYLALLAYRDSDTPLQKIEYLIDGLLEGPGFISKLKKLRSYKMVYGKGGRFLELDPVFETLASEVPKGELFDIGQMFNPRFYFFWDQPDEHDEENFFIPLKKISQKDLDYLEETVFNLLPESQVDVILPEEILLESSSSASKGPDGKSIPNWLGKEKYNHFDCSPLEGYGSYIQKCPGDTRFSVTLSIPHSNSVKLIERQVATIAKDLPWSNYVKDEDTYFNRFNELKDNHSFFLCRDLKKDGITKVRPLIQAVGRALKRRYPGLPAWEYLSIYDDFSVWIDGVRHYPPRGVGLGMSSALTTILQSAIFRIVLDEMIADEEEWMEGSITALFYHDDGAVGATNEATLEHFSDKDIQVLERYGCIPNKRKSFIAPYFVLCENYSDEYLDEKDSYQRVLLNTIHTCENVSHAKMMFASNLRYIHQTGWEDYLKELVAHFGYEFYCSEATAPYQLGGWVPAYYQGVDISLVINDRLTPEQEAAGLCTKIHKPDHRHLTKKYGDGIYIPPVQKVFPGVTNFGGHEKDYKVGMTRSQVGSSHVRYMAYGMTRGYWEFQYKKRTENFHQIMGEKRRYDDLSYYRAYCNFRPSEDVFPPRELLVMEDVDKYEVVDDVYRPPNPFVQFLKYHNPDTLRRNIIPWPYPPGMGLDKNLKLTAEERRQTQYLITMIRNSPFVGELILLKPQERLIPSTYWFNPISVIACCMAVMGAEKLPKGIVERQDLKEIRQIDYSLALKLSNSHSKWLFLLLVDKLGYKRVKSAPLTYVEQYLVEIVDRRKRLQSIAKAYQLLEKHLDEVESFDSTESSFERRSDMIWDDTPLSDTGYNAWVCSSKNYTDFRQHIFEEIEGKIANIEMLTSGELTGLKMENSKIPEQYRLTELEQYYIKRAGYTVDEYGIPNLYVSALDGDDDIFMQDQVDDAGGTGSDSGSGPLFEEDPW